MHLVFSLWQLGRPVNHAFELNAHSISPSKPRAPISLATAEPFQSLDLNHIILIELRRVLLGEGMKYTRLQRRLSRLRDAGLKIQNFEKLWHFQCRCT